MAPKKKKGEGIAGARGSTAGDVYHELWALRAALNFPGDAVTLLRSSGHDVLWIRTDAPGITGTLIVESVDWLYLKDWAVKLGVAAKLDELSK